MTPHLKTCFKCGEAKPLPDFYKHPRMADGHLNKCKECTKRDNRNNREEKIDFYREYDRSRSNLPRRVEARNQYSKTDAYKLSHGKASKKYIEDNPERRKAVNLLNNAVRDGKVLKADACWACGTTGSIHGHHSCYDLPLDVTWLCPSCHADAHKQSIPF